MRPIAVLLLAISACAGAAQSDDWASLLDLDTGETLHPENRITSFLSFDFSTLFMPRSKFLGYTGDHYRRLRTTFTSVKKDPHDPSSYRVIGYSSVGTSKKRFKGTIKLTEVWEYQTLHLGLDDELKDAGIRTEGVLKGHYSLSEAREQAGAGRFEGIVILLWLLDRDGAMRYDDVRMDYSDSYRNNQYFGTWTPYGGSSQKTANWGEYRIPFSGDLDIGAAEFSPDPKYADQGWSGYAP